MQPPTTGNPIGDGQGAGTANDICEHRVVDGSAVNTLAAALRARLYVNGVLDVVANGARRGQADEISLSFSSK